MNLPQGLGASFRQCFQKAPPVLIVVKDCLPPIAPVHDVVNCAGILNSQLARHTPGKIAKPACRSTDKCLVAGTDPCTETSFSN